MARATAFARTVRTDITPILRGIIVTASALALILAGQPLPL